ncbi:MAG: hypothetical protein OEV48_02505 [Acidobacteriota bacterium]|jgi:hypothetical protein|nr:hypothetical protein [Acidobacteriota bacterium]
MEAISYVNIFETKGIEYLLVISFLLGFLLLVRFLVPRDGATAASVAMEPPADGADHPATCVADFECPYRSCVTEILDGGEQAHQEDIVA